METRANYALIGLFTLAAIAAGFGFVYWFSGKDAAGKLAAYRIVFNGSVSGLSRGSLVLYNGLRVGEVTSLGLQPKDPSRVVAVVTVDAATPMNTDTRARLEFQGLTGVASIALSGGGPQSKPLTSGDGQPPVIVADRSDFQDLIESANRIAAKADDVLGRIQKVVDENQGGIGSIVRNVDGFTRALADNSEGIGRSLASIGAAADTIAKLSVRLERLSDGLDTVVRALDPQDVKTIVSNIQEVTTTLSAERGQISTFLTQASDLATKLNGSAGRLDTLLANADTAVKALDVGKIGRAVDNVDKFAGALGAASPRVDEIARNTNQLIAKLNTSADRLDGVLASAQGFLGSSEGKGVFADIGETAKSIRKLADSLDQRTAELTAGIGRATGRGLQSLEAFANDGRRTLNDVSKTLRNLEKNPQQLLFGSKPSIPEYNGRQ